MDVDVADRFATLPDRGGWVFPCAMRSSISKLVILGAPILVLGAWTAGCRSRGEAVDKVASALDTADPAGSPATSCGGYVERLDDGSVRFAVKFPQPQAYVEVFVQQNGVQNIAQNIVSSAAANLDGTYTYSLLKPAAQYHAGDVLKVRFYSYRSGRPGVFTPGPAQTNWLPSFTYGQTTCPGGPPAMCNPYVSALPDGSLRFAVTLPDTQAYVQVFVQQNGVQNVAQNIVASRAANGNGTSTYSLVKPAAQVRAGDRFLTRFYSYKSGQPGVFTPGPLEQIWGPELVAGQDDPCATTCGADGTCRLSQRLPTGFGPFQAAITASRQLTLGDGAKVTSAPGSQPPLVVNLGTAGTVLGAHATVGSLWSNSDVTLGVGARAEGYLVGAQAVMSGADSTVLGELRAHATVPQDVFDFALRFTRGTTDVTATQALSDLAPGAYRKITVKSGATLRVGPGRYDLESLFVEAGGAVKTIAPGALVNIRTGLRLDGQVRSGDPNDVGMIMTYFGASAIDLRDVFEGALFAKVPVSLRGTGNGTFRGSVSGSDVTLMPGSRVDYVPVFPSFPAGPSDNGAAALVGGDGRPTSSRDAPIEVTADNPDLTGGFVFEPEISATQTGPYSHEYEWFGLSDAHITTGVFPTVPASGDPLREYIAGLPYDGSPLPSSPGFPTTARWHYRGMQLMHGTVQAFDASMKPEGVDSILHNTTLWTKLSNSVIVVPVIVVAYDMPQQSAEAAEQRRKELLANIDFLPYFPEGGHFTKGNTFDPTRFMGSKAEPPDNIWSQCGIQFRVVGSFVLPRPAHQVPDRCASQSHSFVQDRQTLEDAITAARPDLGALWFAERGINPIIVESGPLTCSNYYGNTMKADGTIELNTDVWGDQESTTLAHELGHALSLDHRGSSGSGHLMSAGAGSTDRELDSGECSAARSNAKSFTDRLHAYDLALGNVTNNLSFVEHTPWQEVPVAVRPPMVCCSLDGQPARLDKFSCGVRGGTVVSDTQCQVCCATKDPIGHHDAEDFNIGKTNPELCPADRLLEASQCDRVCCVLTDAGHMRTRYECTATGSSIVPDAGVADICPPDEPK
jgi:hypothetical protein